MRDPYEVLGVPRSASEAEIKKAFRKLAKEHHPDTKSTDPKSQERFSEANSAYEILGDAAKRRQFDAGEIGPDGKPRFQGFEGFGAGRGGPGARGKSTGDPRGTEDILNEIFGDAFSGFSTAGARNGRAGRKRASPFEPDMGMSGTATMAKGPDVMVTARVALEDIVGSGKVRVSLPSGRTLDVKIPPGFEVGQQMRLKGQGGEGTPPGDAIVILVYEPHAVFRPDGANLRLDLPVSLDEAVLGAKVRVPTLEGQVEMTLPAGMTGTRPLRLKGKGLPDKAGNRGDIYVTPRIILPDGPDAGLEQLMKRWREMRPSNPRGPEGG
jgi:DnaJ-class molecular chaperone